jgi:ribosomal protein S8
MTACTLQGLVKLKNASIFNKSVVLLKANNFLFSVIEVLYKEGFILSYKQTSSGLLVFLRNYSSSSLLSRISFLSKPSAPKYLNYRSLVSLDVFGRLILVSTTRGVLTLSECKKNVLGGIPLLIC